MRWDERTKTPANATTRSVLDRRRGNKKACQLVWWVGRARLRISCANAGNGSNKVERAQCNFVAFDVNIVVVDVHIFIVIFVAVTVVVHVY